MMFRKLMWLVLIVSGIAIYRNETTQNVVPNHEISLAKDMEWTKVSITSIKDTKRLSLVNTNHEINKKVEGFDIVSAYKVIPIANASLSLNETTLQAISNWFDHAKQNGFEQFFLTSGYRSFAEQQEVYQNEPNKTLVQNAGASEHQTGFAADITAKGISGSTLADTQEGKWLAKTAWEHGFILRYPIDKTQITGIAFEPWHFRFVGQPHAYYMNKNNLCLEEYIDQLKEKGGYSVDFGSESYSIYYVKAVDGKIKVPAKGNYEISSDNTGGYLITVKN